MLSNYARVIQQQPTVSFCDFSPGWSVVTVAFLLVTWAIIFYVHVQNINWFIRYVWCVIFSFSELYKRLVCRILTGGWSILSLEGGDSPFPKVWGVGFSCSGLCVLVRLGAQVDTYYCGSSWSPVPSLPYYWCTPALVVWLFFMMNIFHKRHLLCVVWYYQHFIGI